MALAAGKDGMDLVARILAEAPSRLVEGGWLVCEVGGSVPRVRGALAAPAGDPGWSSSAAATACSSAPAKT